MSLSDIYPDNSYIDQEGVLNIGGCNLIDLIKQFHTPLYVYDELTIRNKAKEFRNAFTKSFTNVEICYASKAFSNKYLLQLIKEEKLGLDVVSGGEIAVAKSVDFPMDKVFFHGNNKTRTELDFALKHNVGTYVLDNFLEIDLLSELAKKDNVQPRVMLRVAPGVDPHTHVYTTTGILDTKFGFSIQTGDAELAIKKTLNKGNLNLTGLHCHLGSPIFETEPYIVAIGVVFAFAKKMGKYGFVFNDFSPGGGFGVKYTSGQNVLPITEYSSLIMAEIEKKSIEYNFKLNNVIVEPGRAIVANAGVALYTVGALKIIPEIRKYVSIDGGMGDNIRPALYQSEYEAIVVNKANSKNQEIVTITGKYCESGDILVRDVKLPIIETGDFIGIPVSGAYNLAMSSHYNMNPKPLVLCLKKGNPRIIRRREEYSDLLMFDEL